MSKADQRADKEYIRDERAIAFHLRMEADAMLSVARQIEEMVRGFAARPDHAEDPRVKHLAEWTASYLDVARNAARQVIALSWKV